MTSLIENIDISMSFNDNNVRVFGSYEEPLFVAKDVCDILGLTNTTDTLKHIDDEYKTYVEHRAEVSGAKQQLNAVTESGLYQLIMKCRKPIAKPFQKM
jgi:anti-repressor protein